MRFVGAGAGGPEQAHHPAHEIEPTVTDPLGLGDDGGDRAAARRAMDRVQPLGTVRTVYRLVGATK